MKYKFLTLSLLLAFSSVVFAQSEEPLKEIPADSIVKKDLAKNAEYFSKGIEAKYQENYAVAIINFENALKFFDEDDASMYELSGLYMIDGRYTEALYMIEQAAKLNPDNKWYQLRLAQISLQHSDYQRYISIYDKLIENEPGNLDYLEDYINTLVSIGQYDKAIEMLDIVETQIGKNDMLFLQKSQIYGEKGDKDKAISELEKLVEYMPDDTQYLAMLAEAYRKAKRDKDAYQIYLKIKKIEPDNKYINVSLMDYYWSNGNSDKAFEELVAAIKNKNLDYDTKFQVYNLWITNEVQKNIPLSDKERVLGEAFLETHPDKPLGYYIIGTAEYNAKNYEKAVNNFNKVLELDNSDFNTFAQLSFCYGDMHDYQKLKETTEKAITYYPQQPLFYLFNGIANFNFKDYEAAVKILEKGRYLSANKELTENFDTYIGDTYNILKNKAKAYEYYDKVLKSNPDNIYVLNNYAYYLSLDGKNLERALEMSEKTIKAEPKNATYLDTYAWILYKLERYQEAKKYMEKVLKYDKKPEGVIYEHFGDILYKSGDVKNAVKNWKKAQKAGGEVSDFLEQKIKDEKIYE